MKVIGEHVRDESVFGVIRHADDLVLGVELDDAQNGTKDFFAQESSVGMNVG